MLETPGEPHSVLQSRALSGHKLLVLSDVWTGVGRGWGNSILSISLQSVTALRGDRNTGSDLRSASLRTCQGGPKKL